jgi:hypothetical protein
LKADDFIDFCDDWAVWYKSTVVDRHYSAKQDYDGNQVVMLRVACNYPEPSGTKEYRGRKVVGFTRADYDNTVDIGSPVIKPYGTRSLHYKSILRNYLKYEMKDFDKGDIVYQSKRI